MKPLHQSVGGDADRKRRTASSLQNRTKTTKKCAKGKEPGKVTENSVVQKITNGYHRNGLDAEVEELDYEYAPEDCPPLQQPRGSFECNVFDGWTAEKGSVSCPTEVELYGADSFRVGGEVMKQLLMSCEPEDDSEDAVNLDAQSESSLAYSTSTASLNSLSLVDVQLSWDLEHSQKSELFSQESTAEEINREDELSEDEVKQPPSSQPPGGDSVLPVSPDKTSSPRKRRRRDTKYDRFNDDTNSDSEGSGPKRPMNSTPKPTSSLFNPTLTSSYSALKPLPESTPKARSRSSAMKPPASPATPKKLLRNSTTESTSRCPVRKDSSRVPSSDVAKRASCSTTKPSSSKTLNSTAKQPYSTVKARTSYTIPKLKPSCSNMKPPASCSTSQPPQSPHLFLNASSLSSLTLEPSPPCSASGRLPQTAVPMTSTFNNNCEPKRIRKPIIFTLDRSKRTGEASAPVKFNFIPDNGFQRNWSDPLGICNPSASVCLPEVGDASSDDDDTIEPQEVITSLIESFKTRDLCDDDDDVVSLCASEFSTFEKIETTKRRCKSSHRLEQQQPAPVEPSIVRTTAETNHEPPHRSVAESYTEYAAEETESLTQPVAQDASAVSEHTFQPPSLLGQQAEESPCTGEPANQMLPPSAKVPRLADNYKRRKQKPSNAAPEKQTEQVKETHLLLKNRELTTDRPAVELPLAGLSTHAASSANKPSTATIPNIISKDAPFPRATLEGVCVKCTSRSSCPFRHSPDMDLVDSEQRLEIFKSCLPHRVDDAVKVFKAERGRKNQVVELAMVHLLVHHFFDSRKTGSVYEYSTYLMQLNSVDSRIWNLFLTLPVVGEKKLAWYGRICDYVVKKHILVENRVMCKVFKLLHDNSRWENFWHVVDYLRRFQLCIVPADLIPKALNVENIPVTHLETAGRLIPSLHIQALSKLNLTLVTNLLGKMPPMSARTLKFGLRQKCIEHSELYGQFESLFGAFPEDPEEPPEEGQFSPNGSPDPQDAHEDHFEQDLTPQFIQQPRQLLAQQVHPRDMVVPPVGSNVARGHDMRDFLYDLYFNNIANEDWSAVTGLFMKTVMHTKDTEEISFLVRAFRKDVQLLPQRFAGFIHYLKDQHILRERAVSQCISQIAVLLLSECYNCRAWSQTYLLLRTVYSAEINCYENMNTAEPENSPTVVVTLSNFVLSLLDVCVSLRKYKCAITVLRDSDWPTPNYNTFDQVPERRKRIPLLKKLIYGLLERTHYDDAAEVLDKIFVCYKDDSLLVRNEPHNQIQLNLIYHTEFDMSEVTNFVIETLLRVGFLAKACHLFQASADCNFTLKKTTWRGLTCASEQLGNVELSRNLFRTCVRRGLYPQKMAQKFCVNLYSYLTVHEIGLFIKEYLKNMAHTLNEEGEEDDWYFHINLERMDSNDGNALPVLKTNSSLSCVRCTNKDVSNDLDPPPHPCVRCRVKDALNTLTPPLAVVNWENRILQIERRSLRQYLENLGVVLLRDVASTSMVSGCRRSTVARVPMGLRKFSPIFRDRRL